MGGSMESHLLFYIIFFKQARAPHSNAQVASNCSPSPRTLKTPHAEPCYGPRVDYGRFRLLILSYLAPCYHGLKIPMKSQNHDFQTTFINFVFTHFGNFWLIKHLYNFQNVFACKFSTLYLTIYYMLHWYFYFSWGWEGRSQGWVERSQGVGWKKVGDIRQL